MYNILGFLRIFRKKRNVSLEESKNDKELHKKDKEYDKETCESKKSKII